MTKVYGTDEGDENEQEEGDSDEAEQEDGAAESEAVEPIQSETTNSWKTMKAKAEALQPQTVQSTPKVKAKKLPRQASRNSMASSASSCHLKQATLQPVGDHTSKALDLSSVADSECGGTASKKVQAIVEKLDLKKVLEGVKLGVSRRHAADTLPKLRDEEQRLVLQSHLTLYDSAFAVCPSELEKCSDAAIRGHLRTLLGVGISCPPHVEAHVWNLKVSQVIQGLKLASESDAMPKLQAFWALVKPYKVESTSETVVDISSVCLCKMQYGLEELGKKALQAIFIDLLLELVKLGEEKMVYVKWLAEKLVGLLNDDMVQEEIHEYFLTLLAESKKYLLGLAGLLGDTLEQLGQRESLLQYKDDVASKITTKLVLFAKGVYDVASYKSLLESFLAEGLSLEVHKGMLQGLSKFWQRDGQMQYPSIAMEELQQMLEQLSVVAADVPEDFLE
eukprot:6463017-Amphidinium_carterae.1